MVVVSVVISAPPTDVFFVITFFTFLIPETADMINNFFLLFFSRKKTSNEQIYESVYELRTTTSIDVGVDEKATTTELKEPTSITERQEWTRSHQDKAGSGSFPFFSSVPFKTKAREKSREEERTR